MSSASLTEPTRLRTGALTAILSDDQPLDHPGEPDPDPRQSADFLAAWTAGSIAALAHADAVTYFRTSGPNGLRTGPDGVFPVWRVFAAIDGLAGTPLYRVDADPRELAVLAVGSVLILGNVRYRSWVVRLRVDGRVRAVELPPYGVQVVAR